MGVKKVVAVSVLLLIGARGFAVSSDSLLVKSSSREVKIGPGNFDATPIDSVLLRKLLVKERLQKKNKESQELVRYQNTLILRNLLNATETSDVPDDRIISTLSLVLEEYQRTNDLKGQALIFNTYGVYYGKKGESEKSIANFVEAMRMKEKMNDKVGIIQITENLAALYRTAGEYDKAVVQNEYYIKLNVSAGRTAQAAEGYLRVAENKLSQNKYNEAEYCILKKALPMFTRTGNKAGRLKSFQTLAGVYLKQRRLSEAKWFYIQAYTLAERLDNREATLSCLINLAEVKNLLGEHQMALDDYRQAELLAVKNNFPVKLMEIKAELGEVYNEMGNYLSAVNALDEYSKLRDNLIKSVNL